jgi:hypothetical protein
MATRHDDESPKNYERRMEQAAVYEAWRKLTGDSRCQDRRRITVPSPIGEVVRLYCLNCGRRGGAVTADLSEAIYICPSCAATHGGLPAPEIPRELILDNPEED